MGEEEQFIPPEVLNEGRILEGEEREKFIRDLSDYIDGLESALTDPDLPEEDRAELEEELGGLKDSMEEIQQGGEVREKS